jgi:hypothetical protein
MVQQSPLKKERVRPASHFITHARRVLSFAEVDEKVVKMPVSRLRKLRFILLFDNFLL